MSAEPWCISRAVLFSNNVSVSHRVDAGDREYLLTVKAIGSFLARRGSSFTASDGVATISATTLHAYPAGTTHDYRLVSLVVFSKCYVTVVCDVLHDFFNEPHVELVGKVDFKRFGCDGPIRVMFRSTSVARVASI